MNTSLDSVTVAVLDDYQGLATSFADWSKVSDRANVTVFRDHLADEDAMAERLAPFDVVRVMPERTAMSGSLLDRLPKLKLIASVSVKHCRTVTEESSVTSTTSLRAARIGDKITTSTSLMEDCHAG